MVEGMRTGVNSLDSTIGTYSDWFEDLFRTTPMGRYFIQNGMLPSANELRLLRMQQAGTLYGPFGLAPGDMPPMITRGAVTSPRGDVTVNAPISVTVNVTTNANPNAIGDAAGTAVRSGLRGALADTVPWSGDRRERGQ
jgi:hypothetical protein